MLFHKFEWYYKETVINKRGNSSLFLLSYCYLIKAGGLIFGASMLYVCNSHERHMNEETIFIILIDFIYFASLVHASLSFLPLS